MTKSIQIISYLLLLGICFKIRAQAISAESNINSTVYTGSFTIDGDKDLYYPVIFKYGNQNVINHLKIFRSYNEAGPVELSPTHKGALLLEIDVNYGGWGGQTYDWRITAFQKQYHTTFAGAQHYMHNLGFVVWLRGGGFVYHYVSDKVTHLQIAMSSAELVYDNTNDAYDVYAPAPLTQVNEANIEAHSSAKISDIFWEKEPGGSISYSGGSVGIGISSPLTPLHLGGSHNQGIRINSATNNAAFYNAWQDEAVMTVNRNGYNGVFTDPAKGDGMVRIKSLANGSKISFWTSNSPNTISSEKVTINQNGNVGIGTVSPASRLHIYGSPDFSTYLNGNALEFTRNSVSYIDYGLSGNSGSLRIRRGPQYTNVAYFNSNGDLGVGTDSPTEKLTVDGNLKLSRGLQKITWGSSDWGHIYYDTNTVGEKNRGLVFKENLSLSRGFIFLNKNNDVLMRLGANGSLGVGTDVPQDFKMAVDGKVLVEKVVVRNSNNWNWPDFVFENNYRLPALSDVEKYIQVNKHLPEIPSASEVEKDGQDLGEMNRLLLKKVEELTLYLIEQESRITELENRLNE